MSARDEAAVLTVSPQAFADRRFLAEPVTIGVPFARGSVRDASHISLSDAAGQPVPVQAQATEWWPDGSIRWALVDFQATGASIDPREYRLATQPGAVAPGASSIYITDTSGHLTVDTGPARFQLAAGGGFPFTGITVEGTPCIDAAATSLVMTGGDGRSWPCRITHVEVEDEGRVRASVRIDAAIGPLSEPILQVIARVHFFAGSTAVRLAITCRNPRRAEHAGGFWELGGGGSVLMRDVSLHIASPASAAGLAFAPEADAPLAPVADALELYQDSSGGVNWRHENHVNQRGEVPCAFRGYRLRAGGAVAEGLRAAPAVRLTHASGSISMAVEHFWENFPKALEADGRGITVRLWPRQSAGPHELQGGEQKTHAVTLAFGADPIARDSLYWGRTRSVASLTPQWYAGSAATRYVHPAADDHDDRYRQLVTLAIEGPDSFEHKRDVIDEYGWRNFGDLYADHENAFAGATQPVVSHYNNQYDAVAGCAIQFMRTGDSRWWRAMTGLATHVTDIDIYHTDRDKAAYNHGLFWHTYHYVAAGRSTHRSYPRQPGVSGGGPANEHNYATGLRLHWLMTGDRLSREAAVGLAQWVIDMDDGRTTILRWLTSSPTGLASATQSPDFHGPGRGAGHSILALLEGYRLTQDRRFLDKAEALIRRCVDPADDVAALDLLDAERRWSYVVFLQALGRYLDDKAELGEMDAPYLHAGRSLLHYARWMADHEYPYLEKPAILEYPTETWAAQDMRKNEVFLYAAQHAAGTERDRFLARANYFFDESVSTLSASATRALTRPVVLLLSNGFMHAGAAPMPHRPLGPAAGVEGDARAPFIPQKAIAKRRLLVLGAAGMALALWLLATMACHVLS